MEYFVSTVSRHDSFDDLRGIAVLDDHTICVADCSNHCIWKLNRMSGKVSTYAGLSGQPGYRDGPSSMARFRGPVGLASFGSILFVADYGNNQIRKVSEGVVSTVKHTPPLNSQFGLAVREDGSIIIASIRGNVIYQIMDDGQAGILAGKPALSAGLTDGPCNEAEFFNPVQLATGPDDSLYVADRSNHAIRKIKDNHVETVWKNLESPCGVATDDDGNVYYCDSSNKIYKLRFDKEVLTVCGSGEAKSIDGHSELASLNKPHHLFYHTKSGYLYFTETKAVRRVKVKRHWEPLWDYNMSRDLAKLLDKDQEKASPDQVVFLVEEKSICVNRALLCVRSKEFERMFTILRLLESEKPIIIENATYESFYVIITYIVTGRIDAPKYCDLLMDVLALADRFHINYLSKSCTDRIVQFISEETALEYLSMAHKHGLKYPKNVALNFVINRIWIFYKKEQFWALDKVLLKEITDQLPWLLDLNVRQAAAT